MPRLATNWVRGILCIHMGGWEGFKAEWWGQLAGLMDPFQQWDDTRCPSVACIQSTLKSTFIWRAHHTGFRPHRSVARLCVAAVKQWDKKWAGSLGSGFDGHIKDEPWRSSELSRLPPALSSEPPSKPAQLLTPFSQPVLAHCTSPSNWDIREAQMEKVHRGPSIMSSRSVSEENNHKCSSENRLISLWLFYCSWFYDPVFLIGWKNTNNCPGTKNRKESVLRKILPLDFPAVLTRCTPCGTWGPAEHTVPNLWILEA